MHICLFLNFFQDHLSTYRYCFIVSLSKLICWDNFCYFRDYLALNVYVALCYYKLDYYDVSQVSHCPCIFKECGFGAKGTYTHTHAHAHTHTHTHTTPYRWSVIVCFTFSLLYTRTKKGVISAWKTSHKHNKKDKSHLQHLSSGMGVHMYVSLAELMHLGFIFMPGESCWRWLRPLLCVWHLSSASYLPCLLIQHGRRCTGMAFFESFNWRLHVNWVLKDCLTGQARWSFRSFVPQLLALVRETWKCILCTRAAVLW